jgi:hypothetical protein
MFKRIEWFVIDMKFHIDSHEREKYMIKLLILNPECSERQELTTYI